MNLQPCPWCGSDTRLLAWSGITGPNKDNPLHTAQIKCKRKTCGMSGPLFKGEGSSDAAQRHWNGCVFHPTMRKAQTPLAGA